MVESPETADERVPAETAAPPVPARTARATFFRLGGLVVVTVGLLVAAKVSGLSEHLKADEIHERMVAVGWWGPLGYLVAFSIGELIHIPGLVFVAGAVVAYGRVQGTALAFVGAIVSLSVSFLVVRAVGGKPLGALRWALARRVLGHLDEHPVRTVVLLRLVLWLTPQVNYALALSNVPFRSYLLGSMIGLVAPVIFLAFTLDHFLH